LSNAVPEDTAEKEVKTVAEQKDVKQFFGKISEHIGNSIEKRRESGKLKDENDPFAIAIQSIRGVREEIEQKSGVRLDDELGDRSSLEKGRGGGKPAAKIPLARIVSSLSILLNSPESLKSLSNSVVEESTFQDYIKLVEEQDPAIRGESEALVRQKAVEQLMDTMKDELKKLSMVLLSRWIDRHREKVVARMGASGGIFGPMLFMIQMKFVETIANLLIEAIAKYSGKAMMRAHELKIDSSTLMAPGPDGESIAADRRPKMTLYDELANEFTPENIHWMLY